jgi:hypothetical protein
VTIRNKSDYFYSISRSTHDDNYLKNATYRHSTCDVYTMPVCSVFFKNWSHVWSGRCTKTSNFLYMFLTREMLVQIVNFEKVTAPHARGSARLGPCPPCPKYKSVTHQCSTSKLCAMNSKNLAEKEKVYDNAKLHKGKCDTMSYQFLLSPVQL